uniref:Uncharacterized protein n=1 Tax=Varanus komodoensis TaxID=61221 RepID=A0A8D2LXP2_VARKO
AAHRITQAGWAQDFHLPKPLINCLMHCPISNLNNEEIVKLRQQCKEESFWYRGTLLCS